MKNLTIPCTLMRAGTSRGPFFLREWLPQEAEALDHALIGAIGASDPLQLDGLGGGSSLNSKVAIVSRSQQPDCDLDYLFAQVGVGHRSVDMRPNCGNMLSGVVPFALEQGLLQPRGDQTTARVFNVNTGAKIDVTVQTPGGRLTYDGDTRIDGVAGTAAPVLLSFLDCWGAVTGALFPTGQRIDVIEDVEVSCIDAAMPMMMVRASAFGVSGRERPAELDANMPLLQKLERLRCIAGARMGLGDVANSVVPKPVLVSAGEDADSITSRYFTPRRCHSSHAVTGAIGVATALALPRNVASGIARSEGSHTLAVLHPEGRIEVEVQLSDEGGDARVVRAALVRTARRIMQGHLTLPGYVFPRTHPLPAAAEPAPDEHRTGRSVPALTIIVPTSAGGANDHIARSLSRALADTGSGPVRVDNRAGASGSIASHYVRSAAPDGSTLLLGYTATHGIYPAWEDVGYDPIADFAPIATVCTSPTVLVVPAQTPFRCVQDVLERAQRGSAPLRYAVSGRGTLSHLASELFARRTGVPLHPAFFDGSGPAIAELIRGHADLMFPSLSAALPHLETGKLRAIAISSVPADFLPLQIPRMRDVGLAELDFAQWYGLLAPAGTPAERVAELHRGIRRALAQPEFADRLHSAGAIVCMGAPDELHALLVAERTRWRAALAAVRGLEPTDAEE